MAPAAILDNENKACTIGMADQRAEKVMGP